MTELLFRAGTVRAEVLGEEDVAALQAFFDANPAYFEAVNGQPAGPGEARAEFDEQPPAGMPFERRQLVKFVDAGGQWVAMAGVLGGFLAAGVWHIGLYIVATRLHGSGAAGALYAALETWMRDQGARTLRLGVALGNTRAERFWARQGYVEVRRREGVWTGHRDNTIRVLVKPLGAGTLADYLALVERDRPESKQP